MKRSYLAVAAICAAIIGGLLIHETVNPSSPARPEHSQEARERPPARSLGQSSGGSASNYALPEPLLAPLTPRAPLHEPTRFPLDLLVLSADPISGQVILQVDTPDPNSETQAGLVSRKHIGSWEPTFHVNARSELSIPLGDCTEPPAAIAMPHLLWQSQVVPTPNDAGQIVIWLPPIQTQYIKLVSDQQFLEGSQAFVRARLEGSPNRGSLLPYDSVQEGWQLDARCPNLELSVFLTENGFTALWLTREWLDGQFVKVIDLTPRASISLVLVGSRRQVYDPQRFSISLSAANGGLVLRRFRGKGSADFFFTETGLYDLEVRDRAGKLVAEREIGAFEGPAQDVIIDVEF